MKRYYLIKVHADFCPTLYVSAKQFHRLLGVCDKKGLVVSVFSSQLLKSSPDYDGRLFKVLFNFVTKSL